MKISLTSIRRTATVGALSLASVLAFVSPASAATDLNGKEPFDTNKLLMSLCTGSKKTTYWFINVQTGELTKDPYNGGLNIKLPYPTERFDGHCYYPKASSWTWTGAEQRVSNVLVNCSSRSDIRQDIQMNGSTTSTTTNSVSGSFGIQWTPLKDVLTLEAGGSYQRSWSYAKASGWSTTTSITVKPKLVGWLALRPEMRTVRSNPVFHVDRYSWGKSGGGQINSSTWRGRGYSDIKSWDAYYDAKANVLDGNGKPAGQYVLRDRAVNSSDC